MPGALPAVTVPSPSAGASSPVGQVEDRLQPRERFGARVATGRLVGLDECLLAAAADGHGHDLVGEAAGVDGRDRASMALQREGVLVRARDAAVDRDPLGVRAHVAVLDGAPQAVGDGRVDQLGVAQAVAEARLGQQVGTLVHGLHAAGDDDLGVAGADRRGGQHDRLEPRAADAVDRRRRRRVGQTGLEERLARRRLAGAALEHLAHEDFVDRRRRRLSRPVRRRRGWRCRRASWPARPPARPRTCRSACARPRRGRPGRSGRAGVGHRRNLHRGSPTPIGATARSPRPGQRPVSRRPAPAPARPR